LKKLAFLGGCAGLGLIALLATQRGHAADHIDSPTLATSPLADINDVYSWMDGDRLNLAMSVSPGDVESRTFGPAVQYVFHVHSKAMIGVGIPGTGVETRVLCTFESNTSVECWVTDVGGRVKDYVKGDPGDPAGIMSKSGKVRMFAGRRSDPFFFNLQGFRTAITSLVTRFGQQPPVGFDAAGCPSGLAQAEVLAIAASLSAQVGGQPPCSMTQRDCFAELNVKMILVQLDKTLVNSGNNFTVGVWASTHTAP
jgi:hypothetical protein